MQLKPLKEQVVVVFGASSGIGRETALRFARRGARVVAAARGREGLDSLVETIHGFGGQALAVPAEAADVEQVRAVAEEAARAFGGFDTWVHVAAVSIWAGFEETTPEEFRRVIEVNLLGQVWGARAALPHLRRRGGGALIHVTSAEAYVALPLQSAYAASKAGVTAMVDALRRELEAEGAPISVTNVLPASINTPLFSKTATRLGVKPRPIPPIYEPGAVADVILYAATHPVKRIYAGGAARFFTLAHTLAPGVVDRVLARRGIPAQRSRETRPPAHHGNLFRPVPDNRTTGDFTSETRRASVYSWLETHPAGALALAGAALGAAGWLAARGARKASSSGTLC